MKGRTLRFAGGLAIFAFCALALVASGRADAQATTTVPVGDLWFCGPSFENGVCDTTVTAGDTVVWEFSQSLNAHTVTDCGASCDNPTSSPLFDSGVIQGGGAPFQFRFTQAGTFNYLCEVHPFEMRGRIIVQAAAQETPAGGETPAAGTTPTSATATPGGAGVTTLPLDGYGPPQSDDGAWWLLASLAVVGALLFGAGAIGLRRR